MGETVEFPSNGHTCGGYLATPPSGRGPGVVVIQEYWGVNAHIRDLCDRFAAEGFVALCISYNQQLAIRGDLDPTPFTAALMSIIHG